jgi:hypothetical protein
MQTEVRDLFGGRWQISVPNTVVSVDDLRIALLSQHDCFPAHSVFVYSGCLLEEDSRIEPNPGVPFTMIDTARFPHKSFATVDNAFQFGVSRYAQFYQRPEPQGPNPEEQRRPGAFMFDDEFLAGNGDDWRHRFMMGVRRRLGPIEPDLGDDDDYGPGY